MQHHFDVELAERFGVVEAILIENLRFWIAHNEANEQNYYEGRYWTYNSIKAFSRLFPYLSEKQLRRALQHLKDEEIIMTGNFNKSQYDRTLWYAFTDKGVSIFPNGQMEIPEKGNGSSQKGTPIPDINTDNKTDIKQDKRGRAARFTPPTVEEVEEYCQERQNGIDAQHFIDYYSARGWMMGKNKMKDWKASVRTWERADAKDRERAKPREGTFTLKGFYGTFTFPEKYKGMSLHACLGAKRADRIKMTDVELAELERLDDEQARWLQNLKAEEARKPLF